MNVVREHFMAMLGGRCRPVKGGGEGIISVRRRHEARGKGEGTWACATPTQGKRKADKSPLT